MVKSFKKIFFDLLLGSFFALALFYSLIIAYGYKIDTEKIELVEAGLINLNKVTENADVFIDGKIFKDKTPCDISDLDIKEYDLSIRKEGYYNWEKKVNVKSDFITNLGEIKLIPIVSKKDAVFVLSNIDNFTISPSGNKIAAYNKVVNKITIYDIDGKIIENKALPPIQVKDITWSNNLKIQDENNEWWIQNGESWITSIPPIKKQENKKHNFDLKRNEIWIYETDNKKNRTLFSRLSSSPTLLKWFSENQIIYAVNNNLNICDTDKVNCYQVLKYSPDAKIDFSNDVIYILEDSKLFKLSLKK